MLELNEKSPTVEVLLRIAKALGVKASALIAAIEDQGVRARKRQ